MNGLVIEGGGRRGIFAAGVLDCLADNLVSVDYAAGVSAGAIAAVDFVSRQRGRTKSVLIPPNEGWTGLGLKKMLASDLDKLIYESSNEKIPFDFDVFFGSETETEIVATNCQTGEPEYFCEHSDRKRLLDIICASCSVPMFYPAVKLDDIEYIDGSIADAVPFQRAFDRGCDKVLVIMAKPEGESATDYRKFRSAIKHYYGNHYPVLTERFLDRIDRYNAQMSEMEAYEALGKIKVIRPEKTLVKPFEMNKERLEKAYLTGCRTAEAQMDNIKEFLKLTMI